MKTISARSRERKSESVKRRAMNPIPAMDLVLPHFSSILFSGTMTWNIIYRSGLAATRWKRKEAYGNQVQIMGRGKERVHASLTAAKEAHCLVLTCNLNRPETLH